MFIDAYIRWIEEEYMRAKRQYLDREKIDYVRSQLDSRFKSAKYELERQLCNLTGINRYTKIEE